MRSIFIAVNQYEFSIRKKMGNVNYTNLEIHSDIISE